MTDPLAEQMAEELEWLAAQVREHGLATVPSCEMKADAWNPADGTLYGVVRCKIQLSFDTGRPVPEPSGLWGDIAKQMKHDWGELEKCRERRRWHQEAWGDE